MPGPFPTIKALGPKPALRPGDSVTVLVARLRHGKRVYARVTSGVVTAVNEKHFTLDTGRYREGFLFVDFQIGELKLQERNPVVSDICWAEPEVCDEVI